MSGAIVLAGVLVMFGMRYAAETIAAAYDRRTDAIVKAKIGEVG